MKRLIIFTILSATLAACGNVNEKNKENADINNKSTVEANNADAARKAKAMEADLDLQQRYFQGVAGRYDGEFTFEISPGQTTQMHLQLTFIPSLVPYRSSRIRDQSEVLNDLNNLNFKVETSLSDDSSAGKYGNTFVAIKPDLKTGLINVVATDYPLFFEIKPVLKQSTEDANENSESVEIARQLLAQELDKVNFLNVHMTGLRLSKPYKVTLTRVVP